MAQATTTPTRLAALRRITDGPGTPTASRLLATTSTDGLWSYEHLLDEPGQPWHATYLPTGQVQVFPSLRSAQTWTASTGALPLLRLAAQDALNAATTKDERGRAARIINILDGVLLTGVEPDTRCECGGYLVCHAGQWRHVDVCKECWTPEGGTVTCPDGGTGHIGCVDREPVQCDHHHCRTAQDLYAQPCVMDRGSCCGCCHGEGR